MKPTRPITKLCPDCGNLLFVYEGDCEVCALAKVESENKGTYFRKELIKTQFLEQKQQWTAFVTWRGIDIQEFGETETTAIYFLLTRHEHWFSKRSKE